MEFLDDPSIRLSFFNSIFELLAGYNFAYAGLNIVSKFINTHLIKTALSNHEYAKKIYEYAQMVISATKPYISPSDDKKITGYYNELELILEKYQKKNISSKFLNIKAKIKFTPLFVCSGLYCFYLLLLSGLGESQQLIAFNEQVYTYKLHATYSIKNYTFVILFIYNILIIGYLFKILLRKWNERGQDRKVILVTSRRLAIRTSQFFLISMIVSFLLCMVLHFEPSDNLLFSLIVLSMSLVICIFPIISLTFWIFGATRIKFHVQKEVIDSIGFAIRDLCLQPPVPRKSTAIPWRYNRYLKSLNNLTQLKWLRVGQFGIEYSKYILPAIGGFALTIYFSYLMLTPKDPKILSIIRNAAEREYQTYKMLPKVDTSWFNSYFTKNSEARIKIMDSIHGHLKHGEVINNNMNPSTYEISEATILNIKSDRIIVETAEYWSVKWFKPSINDYTKHYVGSLKDTQIYILRKENGKWLIDKNNYIGNTQFFEN